MGWNSMKTGYLKAMGVFRIVDLCQKHSFRNVSTRMLSRFASTSVPHLNSKKAKVEITFVKANGERIKASGKEGDTLYDIVIDNNLDFPGYGSCEGTLTCSTCHVIFKQEDFDKIPDKPTLEEADMLDLAVNVTDTSRLGCQVNLTKELNGLEVQLPEYVHDART